MNMLMLNYRLRWRIVHVEPNILNTKHNSSKKVAYALERRSKKPFIHLYPTFLLLENLILVVVYLIAI